MKTFLVTGAAQGFGLEVAKQLLATREDFEVVLPARTPAKVPDLGPRAKVMKLDLARLDDVQRFVDGWSTPLAGLVNNAGVQGVDAMVHTPDGYEETFAVNYLAAFVLTRGLQKWLDGGRVMFIGSSTHVPKFPSQLFGFRGTKFSSIEASARGENELTGADRYSTSKHLCTLAAPMFATRGLTSLAIDPGMMPGTGLARARSSVEQWAWKNVLPTLAVMIPGASTVQRSAKTAAWLMTAADLKNGGVYEYTRRFAPVHSSVDDAAFVTRVFDETTSFLERRKAA